MAVVTDTPSDRSDAFVDGGGPGDAMARALQKSVPAKEREDV